MDDINLREVYDSHPDYVSRRDAKSFVAMQLALEVERFKIPNLVSVVPEGFTYRSIIEVGCGTGELIAQFPPSRAFSHEPRRIGFDISPLNVAAARERFPYVEFSSDEFSELQETADLIILSDVLEHVPDDCGFLKAVARLGSIVLINLPIEDNWTNRNRQYGISDPSGHLRKYSMRSAWDLLARANLSPLEYRRVWSHESEYEGRRIALRRQMLGTASSGDGTVRFAKAMVRQAIRVIPPLGRRLFPSNLFLSATLAR